MTDRSWHLPRGRHDLWTNSLLSCRTADILAVKKGPSSVFFFTMELLIIAPILLLQFTVAAQPMNHTIDDTLGDELTGYKVRYSPVTRPGNASALVWKNASQCSDCAIVPDSATYDSTLKNVTAELAFHGSAIYIYLIVPNYPKTTGLASNVLCNFRMDGKIVGSYNHTTNGTYRFENNVLAYSNASLEDKNHTFLIETTGKQLSYVIFDYALYTHNQATISRSTTLHSFEASHTSVHATSSTLSSISPSSPPETLSKKSVKALATGITIGILAFIIFAVSFLLYCRRRYRKANLSTQKSYFSYTPLFRTIRQPDPVPRVSLDDDDGHQESFVAQLAISRRARNKQLENEDSDTESTTLCSESGVTSPRRASIVHDRSLLIEKPRRNRRYDFHNKLQMFSGGTRNAFMT
ncbi:hypothetical protein F5146DRAFT_1073432 [Armillaria mellea]|nr:hypothetical protein F5146DRAFT_1073432 [Armillaria mellea]